MPVDTLVAEPISIEVVITMEAAIRAMEAWHNDTYTLDCGRCVMCQAMESLNAVINSIYTVYRPS